jgi:quercetin dioxygenase-like cupin family protein
MQVERRKPVFRDKRGVITDILQRIDIDSITVITSKKGAVRGNHFHKKTTQYAYVLEGKFRMFTQEKNGEIAQNVVKEGDFITTPPWEKHAFMALEDSVLLACFLGPRRGHDYEDDTYRLDVPLTGRPRK